MTPSQLAREHSNLTVLVDGKPYNYTCVKHLFTEANPNYMVLYRETFEEDGHKVMKAVALLFRPNVLIVNEPHESEFMLYWNMSQEGA